MTSKNKLFKLLTETKNLLIKWVKSEKSVNGLVILETKTADGTVYELKRINPDHYVLLENNISVAESVNIELREKIKELWQKATCNMLVEDMEQGTQKAEAPAPAPEPKPEKPKTVKKPATRKKKAE